MAATEYTNNIHQKEIKMLQALTQNENLATYGSAPSRSSSLAYDAAYYFSSMVSWEARTWVGVYFRGFGLLFGHK